MRGLAESASGRMRARSGEFTAYFIKSGIWLFLESNQTVQKIRPASRKNHLRIQSFRRTHMRSGSSRLNANAAQSISGLTGFASGIFFFIQIFRGSPGGRATGSGKQLKSGQRFRPPQDPRDHVLRFIATASRPRLHWMNSRRRPTGISMQKRRVQTRRSIFKRFQDVRQPNYQAAKPARPSRLNRSGTGRQKSALFLPPL